MDLRDLEEAGLPAGLAGKEVIFDSKRSDLLPGSRWHVLASENRPTSGWMLVEQCEDSALLQDGGHTVGGDTLWLVFRGTTGMQQRG